VPKKKLVALKAACQLKLPAQNSFTKIGCQLKDGVAQTKLWLKMNCG
jgi:hypothetical protein